jgi:acyl-coenzyme A thioesterase PaaI-like protein
MYERTLFRMKRTHHTGCLFNRPTSAIPELPVRFDDDGILHGEFIATELQQGYDGRLHGGVIAALSDASMAQCLMGHGICGYTVDLSVKYRKPVRLHMPTSLAARIMGTALRGSLYEMKCEFFQHRLLVAGATGRFYRETNR